MTTPNSRVNAVIGSTISMHPLMGSGCLCGEGPRKYDAVAHEKHLSVVIQEALRAARIELVELPEVDRGWSTRNAWTVDESYVVAETDVGVVLEDGDTVAAMRVETATRLAAALLAAAAAVTEEEV